MAASERIQLRPLTLGYLAAETDCDRRTVAKALRDADVEPVSTIGGHPAWTVPQVLAALAQRAEHSHDHRLRRFQRPPAELPGWLQAIDDLPVSDFERGFCLGLMRAVYELPRLTGGSAVQAGATMGQAFETSTNVTVALVHVTFEDAKKVGIKPFAGSGEDGPEIISTAGFVPLDWRKLAAMHGEPDWRPPTFAPGWPDRDQVDEEAA